MTATNKDVERVNDRALGRAGGPKPGPQKVCPRCKGTGSQYGYDGPDPCLGCNGKGTVPKTAYRPFTRRKGEEYDE